MKKAPLIPRTFRLPPDAITAINRMPNRNDWMRNLIKTALEHEKTA